MWGFEMSSPPYDVGNFAGSLGLMFQGLKCLPLIMGVWLFTWGLKCLPPFIGIELDSWGLKCLAPFMGIWLFT